MKTDPSYWSKVFWLIVMTVVVPLRRATPLFGTALAPAITRRAGRS
jgi:hypothetical protein